MSSEDRTWLMGNLSDSDRKKLTDLVDEAMAIGLASNASILDNKLDNEKSDLSLNNQLLSEIELTRLPSFWQKIINEYYKNDGDRKRLPQELMKSVLKSAQEFLSNDTDPLRNK